MKSKTIAIWVAASALALFGYFLNVVALFDASLRLDQLTTPVVIRMIGVLIPPLGAILGLLF